MRLRLLKLCCLILVLVLAGGLIVFDFAGDDLQSAFIETSAVTPAAVPGNAASAGLPPADAVSTSAPLPPSVPAPEAAPAMDTASADAGQNAAPAGDAAAQAVAPAQARATDTPAQADAAQHAAQSAAPANDQASADGSPPSAMPAQAQDQPQEEAPASVASVEGDGAPPPAASVPPAPVAAVEPPPGAASASAASNDKSAFAAAIGATGRQRAAAPAAQLAEAAPAKAAPPSPPASSAHPLSASAATAQAPASDTAYQVASTASPPAGPPAKLVAQTPVPSAAPLVGSEMHDPRAGAPLAGSQVALGPQTLIEFPSLQSTTSGSLAGGGSVTNSSTRVIPGIIGSWTSAPVDMLPLGPSFGGSLFIGAPASGDSVASAATSGGYTLKLGQTNMWPVIMPSFFMGVPVMDGTSASLGTGVWINNIKETATLANATSTQSDEHSGMMVRPFLSAAVMQQAPLFEFLPPDAQKLKVSGGYVFGDSSFQAAFCAAGQTCVKTSDQGSWFLGLSYEFGFPVGGAAPR